MATGQASDRRRAIGMIFQIVRRGNWDPTVGRDSDAPPPLAAGDFASRSTIAQAPVAAYTFFRRHSGLVWLRLDEPRLTARSRRNSRLQIQGAERSTLVTPQAPSAAAFPLGLIPVSAGVYPKALTVNPRVLTRS